MALQINICSKLFLRLASIIFVACIFLQAQGQPVARNLNVADGLPQSYVSGIVQDKEGFIWIGTRDGLARYDGRKFKIFNSIPGDSTGLASNIISNLYLDKKQRLWVIYESGEIDVLYTYTEKLFHLTKDPVFKPCFASVKGLFSTAQSIAEDSMGNTWLLGKTGGVFICNLEKKELHFYNDNSLGMAGNKIIGITTTGQSILLVADTSLVWIGANRKIISTVPYRFGKPHLYNAVRFWKDARPVVRTNGDVLIMDEERLIFYKKITGKFEEYCCLRARFTKARAL